MKVRVTKTHIKNGSRNDCASCPIAIALRDMGMTHVLVADGGEDEIEFEMRGKRKVCEITEKVRNFIDDFDNGKEVKPFQFTLR